MAKKSDTKELREIDNFWRDLFSDDILVGLICVEDTYFLKKDSKDSLKKAFCRVLASAGGPLIKKRSSGLYTIEGVLTEYMYGVGKVYYPKRETMTNELYSELALPSDKFIPLYINRLEDADIKQWTPLIPF